MLHRLNKNNKGVTLVEVIAVIAVLSVVMAAVTGFMITGARMSAQVSTGATAGMREQTAVEFINERLWEFDGSVTFENLKEDSDKEYTVLKIGESELTTKEGKVCYNNVELCTGDIYFIKIDDYTVKYILNETPHVVHLRVGS